MENENFLERILKGDLTEEQKMYIKFGALLIELTQQKGQPYTATELVLEKHNLANKLNLTEKEIIQLLHYDLHDEAMKRSLKEAHREGIGFKGSATKPN